MGYAFYTVKRNDQLNVILRNHYGNAAFQRDREALVSLVVQNNPTIKNINMIFPNQVIMLPEFGPSHMAAGSALPATQLPIVQACSVVSGGLSSLGPVARDFLSSIDFHKAGAEAGQGFVEFVGKSVENAIPDMRNIALEYYRKESGTITTNQYNYRRSVNVKNVSYKIGPLHQLINPGKSPGQILRIRPNAPIRPQAILKQADQATRITKVAKSGFVILKVASLAEAGASIHLASSNHERTTILLDEVSGFVGAAAATAVAVALVGTPVGWIAIAGVIAAGAGGSIVGEAVGKALQDEMLFDENGKRINTKADRMWRSFYGPQ
ncbi:hypothetical protein [Hoeflea ulvae]|uniref:LysM domain-containing protein n=1 Tax=Hoeflea ulvae TaxID=2983764 RepID=A0ABT3YIY6_9HYPH|nr:hypothetical protein [Hoeflea ulvae]MCY0095787.1 hypothetical protein [Hoeflea ulvae]